MCFVLSCLSVNRMFKFELLILINGVGTFTGRTSPHVLISRVNLGLGGVKVGWGDGGCKIDVQVWASLHTLAPALPLVPARHWLCADTNGGHSLSIVASHNRGRSRRWDGVGGLWRRGGREGMEVGVYMYVRVWVCGEGEEEKGSEGILD